MADKVNKQPAAPLGVSMGKEPSPPLPAPSTDDKKQPPLLAVSLGVHGITTTSTTAPAAAQVSSMDKKLSSSSAAVLLVCLYALFNAFIFGISAIVTLIENQTPCNPKQSTWFSWCAELTDAAAAEVSALVRWQLRCSAFQAAAAALALLLTDRLRWTRWALAFAALAATYANHYMDSRVDSIFLAAAGAAPWGASVVVDAVLDLVAVALDGGFLWVLLISVDDEEDSEE